MNIRVIEETPDILPEYEKISIAFWVKSYFRIELIENGLGGVKLTEEKVETPFLKDYDIIEGERISLLNQRFDLSNWGILSAFDDDVRVGGAIMAWKTPEVSMLEGKDDLACLWDIRVAPEYRSKSAGHKLFSQALDWAKERHCRRLKVETQNINVPACRFYARQGCELGVIDRFIYPESINETQLIWYRRIDD